nr:hypothetical protein [uncultured bacterium]
MGEDLANETHLTSMRENIAGIQTPFSSSDPSSTIEEMRAKLNRPASASTDPRLAEAEREYEEQAKRARIDEMLSRYKESTAGTDATAPQTSQPASSQATTKPIEAEEPEQPKTLGRNEGPIRPID